MLIVAYYYEGLTLKQIATRINRSESRGHQIHATALRRLAGYYRREMDERIHIPEAQTRPVKQPLCMPPLTTFDSEGPQLVPEMDVYRVFHDPSILPGNAWREQQVLVHRLG
jgi:hypothetical protein